MDRLAPFAAQYLIVVPIVCSVFAILKVPTTSRRLVVARMLVAGLVAFALAKACGALVYDPRPFMVLHRTPLVPHAAESGMPSDHALLAFTLAFVTWPLSRSAGVAALVAAVLLGAARVACLLHSPLQILVAAAFALTGAVVAATLERHGALRLGTEL